MHITKWEKLIWRGYILCDSNYMMFCKGPNYGEVNYSVDEKLEHREFLHSKTTLYNPKMVDTCYYKFFQTHRMYTKSKPQGKLWTLGDDDVSVLVH